MREIYFDNAATSRVYPEVADIVLRAMRDDYGNPSSKHMKGIEAEKYVRNATRIIASSLRVSEDEIVYTSGATESNNMALFGCTQAARKEKNHIIISAIEHAAIYKPVEILQKNGYEISVIGVDEKGHINLDELKEAIKKETLLVSIIYVNNEIGSIQPIENIASIVHEANADTYLHVDAVQAFGKMRIHPKKLGIDMLSVSGHKLHAPKGIGFLYIDKRVRIHPLIYGGGQQKDMRSGTINVPGIAGLGEATSIVYRDFDKNHEHMIAIKNHIIDKIQASGLSDIKINSYKDEDGAPHIISISVKGVRGEVLLHALEAEGIYVSSGSACSSHHKDVVGTLEAIGLDRDYIEGTIRVSLSEESTIEEADIFVDSLQKNIGLLRKYNRR